MLGSRFLKIQVTMNLLFMLVTLPAMTFFVLFNYRENLKLIASNSDEFVNRAKDDVVGNTVNLFKPIYSAARSAAALAAIQPDLFRREESLKYFYEVVANNPAITSAYIVLNDGALRQVARVAPGNRFLDREAPAGATFVTRWLAPLSKEGPRPDRYVFQAAWDSVVGSTEEPSTYDPRTRSFYTETAKQRVEVLSDPFVSASNGELTVSVSSPIIADGTFLGVFVFNIGLRNLSAFVRDHPVTSSSMTIICDKEGSIIAHPRFELGVATIDGKLSQNRLILLNDPAVKAALAERLRTGQNNVTFRAGSPLQEYAAIFYRFPDTFMKPWEVLILTPTDDFVGSLKQNSEKILGLAVVIIILQIAVINLISRSFAKPVEALSREVDDIRNFNFADRPPIRAAVIELAKLVDAVRLLKGAVEAFTSYMPRGLVKELLDSGQQIKPGGQSRFLTIFFSDLEGFTALSETTPARQLLTQVSKYLEIVSRCINEQNGTIDKFIGDAVMAFWGAPTLRDDHAYQACVAAVRSVRRMEALNAELAGEGQEPMRVRIGIHSDAVLVGNIGSMERMNYTVLGDGVNVASRLENVNKEFGTSICVSHNVFREAGERLNLRPIGQVTVKGRRGELTIYELRGIRDADPEVAPTEADQLLCKLSTDAFLAQVRRASTILRQCSDQFRQLISRRYQAG